MTNGIEPQNQRSQRTREKILAATWRLIETEGPAAATTAAIAREAGVSRRGVYLHFPNRGELFQAVDAWVGDHLELDLQTSLARVDAATGGEAIMDAWASHIIDFHGQFLGIVRVIDRARAHDEGAQAMWERGEEQWLGRATRLAERLRDSGDLAPDWTVGDAADALFALMVAFDDLWHAHVEERRQSTENFRAFFSRLHRRTFLV